ncbi:Obscurin [Gryllus bimaculatus]|nr:Obscurin [Gryllus bimaculatus]
MENTKDIAHQNRFKRAADDKGITLTFVFDSTGSMSDEIQQVRVAMQGIFDHMKSHRGHEIANFALVEFNDPYARLLALTNDAAEYRSKLAKIRVNGGGDCPEMAMEGIKVGLENSNPGSYLFVFTDASAKDYMKQGEVENLIQRKKSKVIFVLTGKCGQSEMKPEYLVYNRIAEVSNGQVFNLLKNEVHKVLDFVKIDTEKKEVIHTAPLPRNKPVSISVHVDGTMTDTTFTATGCHPSLDLKDPTGKVEEGKTILKLDSAIAKQVKDPKPGDWTVSATVRCPGRFTMMAKSSFSFVPGFSLKPTEDLAETAPRPLKGTNNALLIQTTNQTDRIHLVEVKVKKSDGTVLMTMKLQPVKGKSGTYKADMFLPPTSVFFLEVLGRDSKNTTVVRISDSGITPQSPAPPPLVKTLKVAELIINKPGEIPCEVESDVPFTVSWTKKQSSGSVQSVIGSKFTTKSTGNLVISSVAKSDEGEYLCSAQSKFGRGESHISVKVLEPVQVVAKSNKLKFKSQEQLEISCSASGSEPISISWKKDGKDIGLKGSDKNPLILKIKYARTSDAGIYECEASNKINKASGSVKLIYVEKPRAKIPGPLPSHSLTGTKYIVDCKVKGSPKPTISWYKDKRKITSGDFEQVLSNGTLIIPTLFLNHTGQYTCSAENEVGRHDVPLNINVVSTPHFDESEEDIYVDIYGNKSILCNVHGYPQPTVIWERKDGKDLSKQFSKGPSCSMFITMKPVLAKGSPEELSVAGKPKELVCLIQRGNPPPELTWYRDGEVLESKDLSLMESKIFPNGSLIFSYIKPDSEGTYVCEATNVAGKAKRQINLKVQEPPVFINDRHEVLRGRIGSAVPLSCEVYGNPKPTITWMKDKKPLKFSRSIAQKGNSLLIMTKFEHNGTYECVAVNSAGTSKKTIDLLIQDPPRISPPSSTDFYIEKGEDLTLICEVRAFPVAEIKWYKNGLPFENASIAYSENNSSLRLTADLSTSGEYTCVATNEAGHDKIAMNVTVTVAPKFEDIEEYIQASRGDNVTLSCLTDAVPPADYYWLKFPDLEPVLSDSTLTLENVDENFAGLYRCDVSNIAGAAQKIIVLSVYVPPLITAELPKTHIVRKGYYFNMPCHAEGDPNPTITWLKDGKPIPSLEDRNLLELHDIKEDDAGIYTCVAENYEGTDEKNMQILVEAPPVMDEAYPKAIEVNESSSITISCPAISGVPSPTVQWLKNGVPFSPTRRVSSKDKNRSLNIKRAKANDEGVYTCLASNSIGEASANISVNVLIAPRFINVTTNKNINQIQGTTLSFDCSSSGKPTPTVSWYRNDHPFLPILNPRAKILDTGVAINNSTVEDQAIYKCIVENKAGRIERTFNVTVFVTVEDEGFMSEESDASWGLWSPWSLCSKSCGISERVRFRKCSTSTVLCEGKSEEWEQCFVAPCKVDGDWGPWGNWSACSATCGSGVRFRERFCNNPSPEHGGEICSGANRQHESCNSNPCPVDGSWSAWSAWQTCSGPCGNSTTKRTRKCANPIPAFGGKTCMGPKVELKPCEIESCPVHGGWSVWSPWSACSASCGYSSSSRERSCNNPKPKMKGASCSGPSREIKKCDTKPCDDIPLKAQLKINGILNGHNIPDTVAHINISDLRAARLIEARSTPARKKNLWFPYLFLVMSPVTWSTAFQNDKAVNGYTLTGGIFKMKTFVKFSSGQDVTITHTGEGAGPDGVLNFQVHIQGTTPQFRIGSQVKLEPYEEDYIQSGLGELFASSSSILEGDGTSIPFSWNKTINYNPALGKLPSLVETLRVQNIKIKKFKLKEEGSISTNFTGSCPTGFELMDEGFCQDINECSSRRLHNCHFTQTCENHQGGYACTCPPGFTASVKGGKCADVNECAEKPCSHKCVNLEGSFKCLCPPGLALLDSKTNCTSIEVTKDGKVESWKHCDTPKQVEIDGVCVDEDPCKKNLHMCGEEEICVAMNGLYSCISVACPPDYHIFKGIKNAKSCIKYCNTTKCDETNAKISETMTSIILTPGGPIAPFKDLVHLPLNIRGLHHLHTSYQIVQNDKGKSFRVKSLDGNGTLYSTTYLPAGEEYRITVQALTYDDSDTDILFSNKFSVIIHSPTD